MHVNGLRNKFCESDESVIASARECLTPMFEPPAAPCVVMPVFSSGQWAGQANTVAKPDPVAFWQSLQWQCTAAMGSVENS